MTRRRQRSFRPAVFLTKIGAKSFVALFREGQAICSQGDPSKEVFYIEKGQLKVTVKSKRGKETLLGILHPGDHFCAGCMRDQPIPPTTPPPITPCHIL